MKKKLEELQKEFLKKIKSLKKVEEVEALRVKYLGRKGELTNVLKSLKELSDDEKRTVGKKANELKKLFAEKIESTIKELKERKIAESETKTAIDITLPGRRFQRGSFHPVTIIMGEIMDIFATMGFEIEDGPEVEEDYYNFEALNIPADHPARDMQDTFYISDDILLRTHTSPVQIRTYLKKKPPIKILAPGKVFRRDADISHTPMFHQIEGFYVDEEVSFADLKGTLEVFIHKLFGKNANIRFRPSFFPFTEPSAEVDVECVICGGKGCRVCKNSGWIEILGCGMVHPNVFEAVNYDINKYTGFAFGMGIERIAMIKFGIDDIRLFYENDLRFLKQFKARMK
ncbi:MAG: phenylalanine--tRNA ligase subunit alpha [Candidatus Schekmanbacteria bacterium]|nr:MAG: phenylalanine--tRNA ligase subunit alpha [Candidatus Schekmanbacteria bacterium]